jgi:CheY-like chemotaxis protein
MAMLSDLWCAAGSAQTGPSTAPGGLPFVETGRLRVLIVEDEVMIAMNLESLIEDFGFEVCAIAAMGAEAVTFAKALHPNLVLVDVSLIGGMDGVEAARQIREAIDARIIFVTAYASGEVLERIHSTIPDAPIVAKPVIGATLLGVINRTGPQ